MFLINIKGKENPKTPGQIKLELVFFKSGYPRVIKRQWAKEPQSAFSPTSFVVANISPRRSHEQPRVLSPHSSSSRP